MPFWSIDHTEMEAAQERPVAEVLVRFLLIVVLFADYHTDS